jgi:hypothetical protein
MSGPRVSGERPRPLVMSSIVYAVYGPRACVSSLFARETLRTNLPTLTHHIARRKMDDDMPSSQGSVLR